MLAPALARVDGETSGLVGEHRRRLGIHVRLESTDECGDGPDDGGHLAAEGKDREREPDEQETRIREADHEPVVPPQRLQEPAFVYRNFSHTTLLQSPVVSSDG
jgi:hypothetical protein